MKIEWLIVTMNRAPLAKIIKTTGTKIKLKTCMKY